MSNKVRKDMYIHITHYACQDRLNTYGEKTLGCCCTDHKCKKENENG